MRGLKPRSAPTSAASIPARVELNSQIRGAGARRAILAAIDIGDAERSEESKAAFGFGILQIAGDQVDPSADAAEIFGDGGENLRPRGGLKLAGAAHHGPVEPLAGEAV